MDLCDQNVADLVPALLLNLALAVVAGLNNLEELADQLIQLVVLITLAEVEDEFLNLPLELILPGHDVPFLILRL